VISNSELWEVTEEKRIVLQIVMRKWRWISHTVRKRGEYIDKRNIVLEFAGNWKERKTEAKLEEDHISLLPPRKQGNVAKSWSEVKRMVAAASGGSASQMSRVPNGTKGCTTIPLLRFT
jgi:hypothetical protein